MSAWDDWADTEDAQDRARRSDALWEEEQIEIECQSRPSDPDPPPTRCPCATCEGVDDEPDPDDDEPCFECREFDCICPPNQCPECGERCATLCIDDICLRGPCCCFHRERPSICTCDHPADHHDENGCQFGPCQFRGTP